VVKIGGEEEEEKETGEEGRVLSSIPTTSPSTYNNMQEKMEIIIIL